MPLTPLLFLSPRVPWPLNTGAKIRTHALLAALQESFAVEYAGFLEPGLPEAEAREALAGCTAVTLFPENATSPAAKAWLALRTLADSRPVTIAKYWHPGLAALVRRWVAGHPQGIVHADHLHMAPYLGLGAPALRALNEHNVEHRIVERMAEQYHRRALKPYLNLQAARMRRFETATVGRADLVLAVSAGDASDLRGLAPATRVEVIPNGVDLDYFRPAPDGGNPRPGQLIFSGSMNWLPNEDAMIYFVHEILPLLEQRYAQPQGWSLDIVGHAPPAPVQALASARIRVTGTVPDVRPFLREATVYVVPLRIGGGSRLKILEAFAMGIPVVSTSVGCEGLEAEHGRQLLIADTPKDFAAAVARLMSDAELRQTLAGKALAHVRERFGWPAIGGKLVRLYQEKLKK